MRLGLTGHERVEPRLGLVQLPLDILRAHDEPLKRERAELESGADRQPAGGNRERPRGLERENDPGRRSSDGDEPGQRGKGAA